jgi:hypothetical protein
VKKWDKETVLAMIRAGLPECAFWRDRFSKTGTWLNSLFMSSMGRISTFQARTVTATSIYLFFSCFLRSSSAVGGRFEADSASHTTHLGFHKEICRVEGGFTPRIKQTGEGRDASCVRFSVKFCQQ